jgi:hypothetical protein
MYQKYRRAENAPKNIQGSSQPKDMLEALGIETGVR